MGRFIAEDAGKGFARDGWLGCKGLPQVEPRGRDGVFRSEFADNEDKIAGIGFDQIPAIGLKLVKDALGKAGWTEQLHRFLVPDEQTKQMVESNEMIDMRVRDEDLVDASDPPRRQQRKFSEIEQQTALFEQRLHIHCRIAVATIDQARMEKRSHGKPFFRSKFHAQLGQYSAFTAQACPPLPTRLTRSCPMNFPI